MQSTTKTPRRGSPKEELAIAARPREPAGADAAASLLPRLLARCCCTVSALQR